MEENILRRNGKQLANLRKQKRNQFKKEKNFG